MRDAFIEALTSLAEGDPRILLITGDLGFGVLTEFERQFPLQFLNAGIAEQNMTSLAAGIALEGRTVFTYSIGNFPTLRCLEQIRNDVCYHDSNVKVVAVGGGMSYGPLGISHHATEDLAIMRSIPNMLVLAPGDLDEAKAATHAIAALDGPAYLRLDKSSAPPTADAEPFQLGKARRLREGKDVTLVSTGGITGEALRASCNLAALGVSCRVISMHTIKPLDTAALSLAAAETGGIVTIEEHTVDGGLGGAAAEVLLEATTRPRFFQRIGLRAGFSSVVGSQEYLRHVYDLDADAITRKTLACLNGINAEKAS
jgi:transketolase